MTRPALTSALIIEDDAMVRRLLTRHFQKSGVNVEEAGDAEQALRIFAERGTGFDVVVTDVHLPGMSGLDLATEIRMLRADQAIVFVTGDVDEKLAERALESGSAGYLLKPFEFFELDAAIAQAVGAAPQRLARAPDTAAQVGNDVWMAEQRRLLKAAAEKPVDVGSFARPKAVRPPRLGVFVKIAVTVIILMIIAWIIGYGIPGEQREPPAAQPLETQDQRTIYIPYESPDRQERPSRR